MKDKNGEQLLEVLHFPHSIVNNMFWGMLDLFLS